MLRVIDITLHFCPVPTQRPEVQKPRILTRPIHHGGILGMVVNPACADTEMHIQQNYILIVVQAG